MLQFLQSNLSLAVGLLLVLVFAGARAMSREQILRKDLGGALVFMLAFLVLRLGDLALEGHLSRKAQPWLEAAWMVMFAWGTVRGGVSLGLWLVRLRARNPPPKILRDVLDVTLYALALLPIVHSQFKVDLSSLLATSAILSVVLGLALQESLGNLFAGLALQMERPYQVGDWVTIQGVTGKVVQIGWRATRLETFRREVVTLPNNVCSREAVKNYSRDGRSVGVDVYFHSSYDRAPNEVIDAALEVLHAMPEVLSEPPPLCRTWAFDDSGIRYQARYFVLDFGRSDPLMAEFYTRLWYRFRRGGIEIPYPQRTVHMRAPAPAEFPEQVVDDMLQAVDLFSVLSEVERRKLGREMVPRRFGRREPVLHQGAEGNTFYLVGEGELSVQAGGVEVSRLRRGQYFGEMSLLTGEPRAATVVALTDVVLLELGRPAFARLFAEHPELAPKLSEVLAQRRTELQALAAGAEGLLPAQKNHILARLRSIFGLK